MTSEAARVPIYQLKVTLLDTRPPIWGRLQVRSDSRLSRLHQILQLAFGWTDSHLHQFVIDGQYYSEPDDEYDMPTVNERRVLLNQVVVDRGISFRYEYDFGDNWQHAVMVEAMVLPRFRRQVPAMQPGPDLTESRKRLAAGSRGWNADAVGCTSP